jgi:uncharacterized protein with GYD domain
MGPEPRKWRRCEMPKYIVLGKYTAEGIKNIKDSPKRLEAANKLAESLGGKIVKFYYTMGRYDFVTVVKATSDETMMQALLTLGSQGSISTETLTAIPADKGAEILKKLP